MTAQNLVFCVLTNSVLPTDSWKKLRLFNGAPYIENNTQVPLLVLQKRLMKME